MTIQARNPVSKHEIQPEYGGEQADAGRDCRTRLARPNSQARIHFPCSADHEQDWQPYLVVPYSCYVFDHSYIHTKTYYAVLGITPTNQSLSFFSFFFSFISLIADGPHHYHPACGHEGSSHLSPVHALQFFYRDASSALLQLVNQWLNFTYSRSHAFRYERKNTNPTLVRIELTTSVLADVQLTY